MCFLAQWWHFCYRSLNWSWSIQNSDHMQTLLTSLGIIFNGTLSCFVMPSKNKGLSLSSKVSPYLMLIIPALFHSVRQFGWVYSLWLLGIFVKQLGNEYKSFQGQGLCLGEPGSQTASESCSCEKKFVKFVLMRCGLVY